MITYILFPVHFTLAKQLFPWCSATLCSTEAEQSQREAHGRGDLPAAGPDIARLQRRSVLILGRPGTRLSPGPGQRPFDLDLTGFHSRVLSLISCVNGNGLQPCPQCPAYCPGDIQALSLCCPGAETVREGTVSVGSVRDETRLQAGEAER
ncbi:hypothetical protein AAFF_G00303740 [Aldrovandia affinis]|uniref:Uncharacterized protein n=1 Tax=Aldrovandia affinis TaxID=143900 RepID=A0AAD7SPX4_9TELE|nr:hypothetical protein AAFF_G00303740 [Aldrovandia affinis]